MDTAGSDGINTDASDIDGGPDTTDDTTPDMPPIPSNITTVDLGMGSLSMGSFDLMGGRTNAREQYQVTHYIGRTHPETQEDSIHIPIRSYVATCANDTATPRMFVSLTLLDSDQPDAPTYGSVYELAYDPASGGFQPTGNQTLLTQCYETHGIAVSDDCSRVAVLCNTPYEASQNYPIDKDIVAQHGSTRMNEVDNHAKTSDANRYKENEEIWLLEWDQGMPLTSTPATYVVNKTHGGTHLGAQELLYVETDSQGRSSYAFSVSARAFDNNGGSHYSAVMTVINRNDWSIDLTSGSSGTGRGWDWACGDGHVANIRAFYNADTEQYGVICTSDWNDWMGNTHGALGTIAIKRERTSTIHEGYAIHFVPSSNAMVTNGGGHKVIPVDATTNLALIVAPKLIADTDMDRFLQYIGVDTTQPGPYDAQCDAWDSSNNCFITYLMENHWGGPVDFPSIPQQGLFGASPLEARSLSRIGLAQVDQDGRIDGQGFNWFISDADCQVSDPQMVDLHNGRYLVGYGTFQCVSEGEGYNRIGDRRSIIPKSFHLMEIDRHGNVLAGPIDIGNHGWGGLDDIQVLGPGRAAWVYKPNPTLSTDTGPLVSEWHSYVYQSATP